jgi:peroxiredoxin
MLRLSLVCLLAALTGVASADVKPGSEAPDFAVYRRVTLEDFKGQQPLLLMVSAIGCPWAVAELPTIQKLHEECPGVAILVLNAERGRDAEAVAKWKAENNYTFPVAADQELRNAQTYGVAHTPTFFLIDKEGKVQFRHEGSGEDLRKALVADATELAEGGKVTRTEPVKPQGKG